MMHLLAEHTNDEAVLLIVVIQLVVIIVAARVFALVFRRLGQPAVVGEIAAGLIFGPSVFGRFFPGASHAIFDPSVETVMKMLSQLGLIFLLFVIGLEFDFTHLKQKSRAALSVSITGIVLPFALGWGLAHWIHPHVKDMAGLDHPIPLQGFALF